MTSARWTGHLFQGRFASVALDEAHLIAAARYIALDPVRGSLAARARDWPWSSARAHATGRDDALVTAKPLLDRVGRSADLIGIEPEPGARVRHRAAESTGRPLGADEFIEQLERRLGRALRPRKPGRKPRALAPAGLLQMGIEEMDKVSP